MYKMKIGCQKDLSFDLLFFLKVFRVQFRFVSSYGLGFVFIFIAWKFYCIFLVDVWIKIKCGMGDYKKICNNINTAYIK